MCETNGGKKGNMDPMMFVFGSCYGYAEKFLPKSLSVHLKMCSTSLLFLSGVLDGKEKRVSK